MSIHKKCRIAILPTQCLSNKLQSCTFLHSYLSVFVLILFYVTYIYNFQCELFLYLLQLKDNAATKYQKTQMLKALRNSKEPVQFENMYMVTIPPLEDHKGHPIGKVYIYIHVCVCVRARAHTHGKSQLLYRYVYIHVYIK